MKILVTGGAGYIGSHMALNLLDSGHSVTVIDDLSNGNKELIPKEADFLHAQVGDIRKIEREIDLKKYDAAIHFAAKISVEESTQDPISYFKNNVLQSIEFIELCVKHQIKNFIFSSTAAIYKSKELGNIKEDDIKKPNSPYGLSKLALEDFLIELSQKGAFNLGILRYFNVAGADPFKRSGQISKVSTHLLKILAEYVVGKRKKVFVYGDDYDTEDGTGIRDYIHVSDLVDIHSLTLDKIREDSTNLILNCGYGRGFSVLEIIKAFEQIAGKKVNFEVKRRRPGDVSRLVADITLLSKNLSWNPKHSHIENIISDAIEWEKKISD